MSGNETAEKKHYPAIITSLRSPLSVFGLAMLICNAVFSLSAAIMQCLDAFTYSIHTFLAIVFTFVVIAIWSPRSLYHPADLKDLDKELPEIKHARLIITLLILIGGFSYLGYQAYKLHQENKLNAELLETTDGFEHIKALSKRTCQ